MGGPRRRGVGGEASARRGREAGLHGDAFRERTPRSARALPGQGLFPSAGRRRGGVLPFVPHRLEADGRASAGRGGEGGGGSRVRARIRAAARPREVGCRALSGGRVRRRQALRRRRADEGLEQVGEGRPLLHREPALGVRRAGRVVLRRRRGRGAVPPAPRRGDTRGRGAARGAGDSRRRAECARRGVRERRVRGVRSGRGEGSVEASVLAGRGGRELRRGDRRLLDERRLQELQVREDRRLRAVVPRDGARRRRVFLRDDRPRRGRGAHRGPFLAEGRGDDFRRGLSRTAAGSIRPASAC